MEQILAIIIEYASIWAPSLIAILGVVATVIGAAAKTKEAFDKLNKDETLRGVKERLETLAKENEELVRCNKLLLEQITKIRNYADEKKKED